MFKWRLFASIFVLLFVFNEAKAGDKEDVLAEMKNRYSALISGDVDAMRFNPHTQYNVEGGLIARPDPSRVKAWMEKSFAVGLELNIRTFHENVDVFDNAAVFTCYEEVYINPPEGEEVNDTRRVTVVLVKNKGQWLPVHVHLSYLTPTNPE